MRFAICLIGMLLLIGCSAKEALPLTMEVTRIEVFEESVRNEFTSLLTISDPATIAAVVSELNQLHPTNFNDPEPPANFYKIIMENDKHKRIVFIYADRVEFGGKIYTEQSAEKGAVWKVTEKLAELLLEDKRKPYEYA